MTEYEAESQSVREKTAFEDASMAKEAVDSEPPVKEKAIVASDKPVRC